MQSRYVLLKVVYHEEKNLNYINSSPSINNSSYKEAFNLQITNSLSFFLLVECREQRARHANNNSRDWRREEGHSPRCTHSTFSVHQTHSCAISLLLFFLLCVVAFIFPDFKRLMFFPFNKELDWEWKKEERAGNKEANKESNSNTKIYSGSKTEKIGLRDFQKWISVRWKR